MSQVRQNSLPPNTVLPKAFHFVVPCWLSERPESAKKRAKIAGELWCVQLYSFSWRQQQHERLAQKEVWKVHVTSTPRGVVESSTHSSELRMMMMMTPTTMAMVRVPMVIYVTPSRCPWSVELTTVEEETAYCSARTVSITSGRGVAFCFLVCVCVCVCLRFSRWFARVVLESFLLAFSSGCVRDRLEKSTRWLLLLSLFCSTALRRVARTPFCGLHIIHWIVHTLTGNLGLEITGGRTLGCFGFAPWSCSQVRE